MIQFGIDVRGKLTGADLYVKIMQAAAVLVLPYVFLTTSYQVVLTKVNVFSLLFDLGISSLPRIEALGLSLIYRLTASEVVFFFVMMAIALIFGIVSDRLLHEGYERALRTRKVFMVLIAIDLVIRIIPMKFNAPFGIPMAIIGSLVRVFCIFLIYRDISEDKKSKM